MFKAGKTPKDVDRQHIIQTSGIGTGVLMPPKMIARTRRYHGERVGVHAYPSLVEVLDLCDKDVCPTVNSLP